MFIGELSLAGVLRHIDGVLPMTHELGIQMVYLPEATGPEAAPIRGLEVIPVPSMSTLVAQLRDFDPIPAYEHAAAFDETQETVCTVDFEDITGQMDTQNGDPVHPALRLLGCHDAIERV